MTDYLLVGILITLGLIWWGMYDFYKLLTSRRIRVMTTQPAEPQQGPGPGDIPMQPRVYKINADMITDVESIKEFVKEMDIRMVLFGDQRLEDQGKRPEWWTQEDTEEVLDA